MGLPPTRLAEALIGSARRARAATTMTATTLSGARVIATHRGNLDEMNLTGSCFCGVVSYALSGKPLLSAYCHCTNCQRLTGCPFVHTIHFPASAFTWTHAARLDAFVIPDRPWKTRFRCPTCGACVASANSKAGKYSVGRAARGALEAWDAVRPTAHIFYGTRMLDVPDALGKWEGYEGASARLE
ncbi:hypothetical protein A0H81_01884 [Grifola frondosa]|uniref:CENP-V/GFA domain-containing protein n=1 Tax=Grifola frondosa TaxID=5627 RepID=A0A1C7MMM2_GRIFR|nr:hypothetical protein A0H81_01884 [Grifola frondosa]